MKVILQSDITKVGKRFDTKDVNSGYATNFLIPRKLAIVATPEALKRLAEQKARMEGEKKVQDDLLIKNLNQLDGKSVTMVVKANEKGHLFAGIHKTEIAEELSKQTRLQISSESIFLEHPIKEIGKYEISLQTAGKKAKFELVVETKL